ncbi:HAD-like protein [Cryphonectria parasitica EP155]|uniref:HAD-like protein n=1 Tax=Cryphonectria parasitica (strain ATCC 38755 / EP155) TaxID=660469 RepID=A0A9P4XTH6_CRYP1|nr:HAD-like protein [Cryphonectria parasitica EP155]KAF3760495.1 HAD-like protein [Cryphonectria parasitica EP155]
MLPDEQPVEYILDSIDTIMAASAQPKVILFDIGGVVLASPFQSILDYELSLGIPPGWVNYSISKTSPDGYWHRLETGRIPLDDAFYSGFSEDLHSPTLWQAFYETQRAKNPTLPKETPPVPRLDAEWLFNDMMATARHPDPWMFPALQKLQASGKYILAALSNTIIFPPGHELHRPDPTGDPVRGLFDVFISSAHVGMRKPDPRVYQYALQQVNKFAEENASSARGKKLGWGEGIQAGDVVFLDDIGANLKGGKKAGFRTVKVDLGRAYQAVDELERITGLKLAGTHPKVAIRPKLKSSGKPRI